MNGLARRACHGSVVGVVGDEVELRGLRLAVGDAIDVDTPTGARTGEVVAVDAERARCLVHGPVTGIAPGTRVRPRVGELTAPVGERLLGRVVDALGRPLDGLGPLDAPRSPVHRAPPAALERMRIDRPLTTGVRLVDTLCTIGRGQRMGIFAGSGVGKSTLLAMMVRGTDADRSVIALVGERGREVREFIEDVLGPDGLARSVVVVATSDEPPLLRLRAATYATRLAEVFADDGHDVLLTVDSITRLATAQRDVGLAAGEPPTTRGHPPSVFSMLPRVLERAGPRTCGTVTGFYTVLVEGGDHDEPVADAARAILDGHLVLDRNLTNLGRFPSIDPLTSVSRLYPMVTSDDQQRAVATVRAALSALDRVRDLVDLGAYVAGADPVADAALAHQHDLIAFLTQPATEIARLDDTWDRLTALAQRLDAGARGEPEAATGDGEAAA